MEFVEMLTKNGANVNIKDAEGQTPLEMATEKGNECDNDKDGNKQNHFFLNSITQHHIINYITILIRTDNVLRLPKF